jgi:D-hexose-6-phosphate mutarotase
VWAIRSIELKTSTCTPLCATSMSFVQATCEIYLYGAHVTSWTVQGKELLFLSEKAVFKAPKAIRWSLHVSGSDTSG